MNLIEKIKQKINIWSQFHNPYHYWWKARKYFKPPKPVLVKGDYQGYFGLPIRKDYYKIPLSFFCTGLGWKWKYDEVRHEWNPIICFIWTNPWKTHVQANEWCDSYDYNKQYWFGLIFVYGKNATENVATWEALLDHTQNGKTIEWCKNNHIWYSDKDGNITINNNLK